MRSQCGSVAEEAMNAGLVSSSGNETRIVVKQHGGGAPRIRCRRRFFSRGLSLTDTTVASYDSGDDGDDGVDGRTENTSDETKRTDNKLPSSSPLRKLLRGAYNSSKKKRRWSSSSSLLSAPECVDCLDIVLRDYARARFVPRAEHPLLSIVSPSCEGRQAETEEDAR